MPGRAYTFFAHCAPGGSGFPACGENKEDFLWHVL